MKRVGGTVFITNDDYGLGTGSRQNLHTLV